MAVVEGTREGRIGWITFRRPDKLNALNPAALDQFKDAVIGWPSLPLASKNN